MNENRATRAAREMWPISTRLNKPENDDRRWAAVVLEITYRSMRVRNMVDSQR